MHINHLTMMKIESIIPPKKYRYVFPFIDYRFNLMMYPSGAYMYLEPKCASFLDTLLQDSIL